MRLGYIMFSSSPECKEDDIDKLKAVGCDKIFVDHCLDCEEKRPQWRSMIRELRRNDEIVIIRLSNAVRDLLALASFFETCRIKKIRLISLRDKFDSWDELFPSSISQLIDTIGSFPGDVRASQNSGMRIKAAQKRNKTSFQTSKEEREKRCVDLYNNRTSIKDIKDEVGFRSNSSVYRVLKEKGIKVNRRTMKDVSSNM